MPWLNAVPATLTRSPGGIEVGLHEELARQLRDRKRPPKQRRGPCPVDWEGRPMGTLLEGRVAPDMCVLLQQVSTKLNLSPVEMEIILRGVKVRGYRRLLRIPHPPGLSTSYLVRLLWVSARS